MKTISLNGSWKLRVGNQPEWIDALVPGTVYADLLRAGKMEDPFYRDNEQAAMALMEQDFTYKTTVYIDDDFLNQQAIYLRCEGLDTIADITVNGKKIAHVENMHRTWEFDMKDALKLGDNVLEVYFYSPLRYIRKAYQALPAEGSGECTVGFPTLRKAHCQFGWDWGPRMPDAGIWRNIELIAFDKVRVSCVAITQKHQKNRVQIDLIPELEIIQEDAFFKVRVSVKAPDGTMFQAEECGEQWVVVIDNPSLWWPNGLGKQPLYEVEVMLSDAQGLPLDGWKRRIGLRTMEVHREKDQWGESFAHCVNGVDFFAMGADYIPEDSVFGRRSAERTRRLLEDCALANYNVIRVWGGGFYPDDCFFDICDELGLVVWQDYMFACAVYNLTPEFEQNIMCELCDNIKRIRHHASVGLFCGNNEMEMFVKQGNWVLNHGQRADYIKMYEYLFPKLTKELAPQIFYWPASPSSGGSFDEPNAPDRGDVHFWEVWHGNKPFSEYQKHYFRYLSEFGFESFPCKRTIDSFAKPEEQNIFSYVMEKHQKKPGANGIIVSYLSQTFLYPTTFDRLIYASQLLQAQAVAYGVEHLRRHRGRCMGAVYWQVNDCWPVASWSSIDYFGRWKALHYFAKRFFAPVLLSAQVDSALTKNPDINQEFISNEKTVNISVSNETFTSVVGKVKWEICKADGTVLEKGEFEVLVEPLQAQWIAIVDACAYGLYDTFVQYRLENEQGEVISQSTAMFCPPKYFHFQNPKLSAFVENNEVVIQAENFAKAVCIQSADEDLLLEDNYFDMNRGTKRVKILRGDAKDVIVCSVYDIR